MALESSTSSTSTLPLQERVAIVTGASRGIGRAIAVHLASLGAKVVVNYTTNSDSALAQEVVSQINPPEGETRAIAVQADVSDPAQVEALFEAAEEAFNTPAHILVNSAGVQDSKHGTIAETRTEDFDEMFAVNTKGTFLVCREAAKRLKRGAGGRIITFSSSLTAVSQLGFGAYTASKAAVEAMTKILAKELRGTQITANCIAPGPIATELFFAGVSEEYVKAATNVSPLTRLSETKDIASVVAFLAGDSAEWVNGQVIRVNGGIV